MKLPEYCDFTEKNSICDCTQVNTPSEFNLAIKSLSGDFIYRGMREAKWKNYTSGQREWITKKMYIKQRSYNSFINKLLSIIKKQKVLCDYLNSIGVYPNDLYFLSLMQHYGCPTPLLDFTHNLDVALYFAFENMQWTPSSNEIENYVSVYYVSWKKMKQDAADILNLTREAALTNEEYQAGNIINWVEYAHAATIMPWLSNKKEKVSISDYEISFLCPQNESVYIEPTKETLYCSNLNLIAQKGCFLIYPIKNRRNQFLSLEEFLNQELQQYHKDLQGDGLKCTSSIDYSRLSCLNIHKSLYEYIKNRRKTRKYFCSKENIYPNINELVKRIYTDYQRYM